MRTLPLNTADCPEETLPRTAWNYLPDSYTEAQILQNPAGRQGEFLTVESRELCSREIIVLRKLKSATEHPLRFADHEMKGQPVYIEDKGVLRSPAVIGDFTEKTPRYSYEVAESFSCSKHPKCPCERGCYNCGDLFIAETRYHVVGYCEELNLKWVRQAYDTLKEAEQVLKMFLREPQQSGASRFYAKNVSHFIEENPRWNQEKS